MDKPTLPDQLRMDKKASALVRMTVISLISHVSLEQLFEVGCPVAHCNVWEMWKGSLQSEKTNTAEPQTDFEG